MSFTSGLADIKSERLARETSSQIQRCAAFDIGSGRIKMQVSDVNWKSGKILNVLLTETVKVASREDLMNHDNQFSSSIQNELVEAIENLMSKAASFKPDTYCAIATESFRIAKNAKEVIDRLFKELHLPVTIITQEEEGRLGFITAINDSGANPDQVIVWDFGGGSFQLTTQFNNQYEIYEGKFGKIPFKNVLLKFQGKEISQIKATHSPHPISRKEFDWIVEYLQEQLKDLPEAFRKKLAQKEVKLLGVGIYPFYNKPEVHSYYSSIQLFKEIEDLLELDDQGIREKNHVPLDQEASVPYIVSNLILSYGILKVLGINEVHYVGTPSANAVGLLLSPEYWKYENKF
jgi:exopolyphosphatase/guanosine-5'-triphosphate,3'-diphosphate pyrophosphatase